MVWRVLSHYGIAKAAEVVADLSAAIADFDPAVVSGPQLAMIETEHAKLGTRLAQIDQEIAREHRETSRLSGTYKAYLQAAHLLAADRPGVAPAQSREIDASLTKLIDRLEELKPEIEREAAEDSATESWKETFVQAHQELSAKIREAARGPAPATRPRLDDRRSRQTAAIAGSLSAACVAIDTMIQQSANLRAQSGRLILNAGLLRAEQLEADPLIGAAVEQARRLASGVPRDLSVRLAALGDSPEPNRLDATQ